MSADLSKSQIDRLGDRLRRGSPVESDLRSLDEYRRSFEEAYATVVGTIRDQLGLEPTGRPTKSTGAVVAKLQRESIRLTQIQDMAGARVVVANIAEQERVLSSLRVAFPIASIVDRRTNPSYGYRAVHVIVAISEKAVEIQVRSALQHLWAEFSEKLSDEIDPRIKYGGGPDEVRARLAQASEAVATLETAESMVAASGLEIERLAGAPLSDQDEQTLRGLEPLVVDQKVRLVHAREKLSEVLKDAILAVVSRRGWRP